PNDIYGLYLVGTTLTHAAGQTATYYNANSDLYFANGATFNNVGTFSVVGSRGIYNGGGATSTFNNSGTYVVNNGGGTHNFGGGMIFNNTGLVDVPRGKFDL